MGQVDRASAGALLRAVVERDLHVTGTLGYEKAEVTAGGVPLAEVNTATLESRRCPSASTYAERSSTSREGSGDSTSSGRGRAGRWRGGQLHV